VEGGVERMNLYGWLCLGWKRATEGRTVEERRAGGALRKEWKRPLAEASEAIER
jgi:hypothetical protein